MTPPANARHAIAHACGVLTRANLLYDCFNSPPSGWLMPLSSLTLCACCSAPAGCRRQWAPTRWPSGRSAASSTFRPPPRPPPPTRSGGEPTCSTTHTLSTSTSPALGRHTGRQSCRPKPLCLCVLALPTLSRAAHRWLESLSLSLNSSSSATPSHVSAFLHAPTDAKATMLLAAPIEVKASLLAALVLLVALSFACFRRRTVDSPRLPLRASMTSRLK